MAIERDFVTLHAADGESHDALLHVDRRASRARERRTGRRTAQIHVHGIMGNFLVGTLRFLPGPLARAGHPMLVAETRMGNVGQLFGNAILEDALLDLDAAVEWLLDAGYDSLVLSGYSSGATMAVRFAATRDLPHLRALVLVRSALGAPAVGQAAMRPLGVRPRVRRRRGRGARSRRPGSRRAAAATGSSCSTAAAGRHESRRTARSTHGAPGGRPAGRTPSPP